MSHCYNLVSWWPSMSSSLSSAIQALLQLLVNILVSPDSLQKAVTTGLVCYQERTVAICRPTTIWICTRGLTVFQRSPVLTVLKDFIKRRSMGSWLNALAHGASLSRHSVHHSTAVCYLAHRLSAVDTSVFGSPRSSALASVCEDRGKIETARTAVPSVR